MNRYRKYIKNNDLLYDNISYNGDINNPTEVKYISYNESEYDKRNLEYSEIFTVSKDKVSWMLINGFNELEWIIKMIESVNIPRLVIIDLFQHEGISNVYSYNDNLIISVKLTDISDPREKRLDQLILILGKDYILTIQEKDSTIFDDIIEALASNQSNIRYKTVNYLFFIILNHIISIYTSQLQSLRDEFESMEDELLENYNTDDEFRARLKTKRNIYQIIKQHVASLKTGINNDSFKECGLFEKRDRILIHSVREQLNYQEQLLEICRETFSLVFNLYISNNDLRMNEIMKRLTVISAIFIPLTFLVGVWGMNYEFMPELSYEYGYFIAWGIMVLIALLSWWYMRRRRWY